MTSRKIDQNFKPMDKDMDLLPKFHNVLMHEKDCFSLRKILEGKNVSIHEQEKVLELVQGSNLENIILKRLENA